MRVPFIIIDSAGEPLRDLHGDVIEFADAERAAEFLMPGEQAVPALMDEGSMQGAANRRKSFPTPPRSR